MRDVDLGIAVNSPGSMAERAKIGDGLEPPQRRAASSSTEAPLGGVDCKNDRCRSHLRTHAIPAVSTR